MAEYEGQLPKMKRLSLLLKGNRFKKVEETAVAKGFVSDNTAQSTSGLWEISRCEKGPFKVKMQHLWRWYFGNWQSKITMFLLVQVHTWNKKGNWGPVSTTSYLSYISGLLHFMRGLNPDAFNILDHSDHNFLPLHVLDTHWRQLCHSRRKSTFRHKNTKWVIYTML